MGAERTIVVWGPDIPRVSKNKRPAVRSCWGPVGQPLKASKPELPLSSQRNHYPLLLPLSLSNNTGIALDAGYGCLGFSFIRGKRQKSNGPTYFFSSFA